MANNEKFIFLAMLPETGQEVHVKWEGHKTKESAEEELSKIRELMIKEDRVPMDCYIYEAEKPPYDLPIYKIDEVDFNFYREKTEDEKARSMARFNQAMSLVKQEALKEAAGNA